MKALVCEMCSSNELIKQDGMYVCQHCGTKYTVEEAKKLMVEGTVKIDKSEETEKLLVLARRARKENNSENAEKYYGMILQDNPSNWEAAFFQVYYQAKQCTIANIPSAANSVVNSINSTLSMVSKIQDEKEKNEALDTIINYSISIATVFYSSAHSFRLKTNAQSKQLWDDCVQNIASAYSIYQTLEIMLKQFFSNDNKRIIDVQKAALEFLGKDFVYLYLKDLQTTEVNRLIGEIKSKNPSYIPPEIKTWKTKNKASGGCYVATAVYGSYDCPQVWTLRRYRDDTLAKTWHGRAFIHTYYAISPTLVKWFGNTDWFRNMWKPKLDKMVSNLNSEGVENTPYEDKKW